MICTRCDLNEATIRWEYSTCEKKVTINMCLGCWKSWALWLMILIFSHVEDLREPVIEELDRYANRPLEPMALAPRRTV